MKARVKIIFPNNNDELKIINEYELKKFKPIEKEEDKPKKKTMKDIFIMKKHKC